VVEKHGPRRGAVQKYGCIGMIEPAAKKLCRSETGGRKTNNHIDRSVVLSAGRANGHGVHDEEPDPKDVELDILLEELGPLHIAANRKQRLQPRTDERKNNESQHVEDRTKSTTPLQFLRDDR